MNKKNIGINFELRFEKIVSLNPSFDLARVAIAYSGRNRNRSDIGKEVFDNSAESLKNIPLVGRYIPEESDFGAHDIQIVSDNNGALSIENATIPFGVIPESTNLSWELIQEEDGTEREYLFTDCILWKRSYGYETLVSKKRWNQSMEIVVDEYTIDADGYLVITKMHFEALCILGENVEPCFESASVQIAGNPVVSDYRAQFSLMFSELKDLASQYPIKLGFDTTLEEGGIKTLILTEELRDQILAEFNISLGDITFEIAEDMTEADFRAKLEEFQGQSSGEGTDDGNNDGNGDDGANSFNNNNTLTRVGFAATYLEKRHALENALDPVFVKDGDGNVVSETYFWIYDFDDEYVFVEKYTWTKDNSETTYGRFKYSFDEESNSATTDGDFEEMFLTWLTADEKNKLDESREVFEELKKYKAKREKEDRDTEIKAVLSEFSDFSTTEEYAKLIEKLDDYNVETLRDKLFSIKGRYPEKISAPKKPSISSIKIPITDTSSESSGRYGGIFSLLEKED